MVLAAEAVSVVVDISAGVVAFHAVGEGIPEFLVIVIVSHHVVKICCHSVKLFRELMEKVVIGCYATIVPKKCEYPLISMNCFSTQVSQVKIC